MNYIEWLTLWLAAVSPLLQVAHGEEVNPASQYKAKTIPDGTMPPERDFTVFRKDRLSRWDDENQSLITNELIPGDFRARMHLSNGYVLLSSVCFICFAVPLMKLCNILRHTPWRSLTFFL